MTRKVLSWAAFTGLLAVTALVYSNHFGNAFQFDDGHTIVENPWITSLHNIPRFFADGDTFSSFPPNRSWRPVVSTSIAIDYWLGGGLHPLWFHISTFFWFLVQLALLFVFFRVTLDRTRQAESNGWVALFATAIYALHPLTAETVNYIIQRADLYVALGIVTGLTVYICLPRLRVFGLYLIPVVAAMLSKPSAVVFPALLFFWIWWFEQKSAVRAIKASVPAAITAGGMALLAIYMTPASFVPGGGSALGYRMSQPAVLLSYFRLFFVPTGIISDSSRQPFLSVLDVSAIAGWVFLAALCTGAWWFARQRPLRPIAFGLVWFVVSSLPTSLVPLAELENTHRMFLPLIGLALSAAYTAALAVEQLHAPAIITTAAAGLILVPYSLAAHERNRVWHDPASLWHDVTEKDPANGRALMNYGITLLDAKDYAGALRYFQRASPLLPAYYAIESNLGIAWGAMGNRSEAEKHFRRSIEISPSPDQSRYLFARWLREVHRPDEAEQQLNVAKEQNPDYLPATHLLMQMFNDRGDTAKLLQLAKETLARFPGDSKSALVIQQLTSQQLTSQQLTSGNTATPAPASPEAWLQESLLQGRAGRYEACIEAARKAIAIRPDYAEAWNNIAVAYSAMSRWDEAIDAATRAVQFKPGFRVAQRTLAEAKEGKTKSAK